MFIAQKCAPSEEEENSNTMRQNSMQMLMVLKQQDRLKNFKT